MSNKFTETLFVSAPKELDYLLKTYCKETSYFTLPDLRQKHKEYVFNIIRMIRRCMETQLLNVNSAGVGIYSLFNQLLAQCLEYYNKIPTCNSIEQLREECTNFNANYIGTVENLNEALDGRSWLLDSDLKPRNVRGTCWQDLARKVSSQYEIKGHHLNILIPYPEEDLKYTDYFNYILRFLFQETARQYYSFYTESLDSRLFANGQYLHVAKERANIKAHSFDAVVVTHDNMFDDIRPRINSAINYLKKNGAMIIVGLSTDFKRLDLRRITSVLQDVHVYFESSQISNVIHDYEICMIIGHVKDPQASSELPQLLDIFATHEEKTSSLFTFYGSDLEEKPLFASYDITEAEATVLLPDMQAATNRLLANLIPKTITDTRRPLLPFSSGQLGLVLISGDINGMIQEKESGCCHVVKGSSKQNEDEKSEILETDDEGRPRHVRRTKSVYAITNVNVVLPNGVVQELH